MIYGLTGLGAEMRTVPATLCIHTSVTLAQAPS